jgi:hypothetical protein
MDYAVINNIKLIKTAGGKSIFFSYNNKLYKKDASDKHNELNQFYEKYSNNTELIKKFPKYYGVVSIKKEILELLVKKYSYLDTMLNMKIYDINMLVCMENLCSQFTKPIWILDIKMAIPKSIDKYHISRTKYEFVIHGINTPNCYYNHRNDKQLDYSNINNILRLLKLYFPNKNLIEKVINEVTDINNIFKKYSFEYDYSVLMIHDMDNIIIKVIDCSIPKHNSIENIGIKRLDYLLFVLDKLKKIY